MGGLPGYRMKVERAKRHIRELAEEVAAFHSREPYAIRVHDDLQRAQRTWKVEIREEVPECWSAIVGDAIHNARASLDLMMVAVVKRCDPNRTSYNHVHFIVGETKKKFEDRLPENIKGASPEARRLIENLKPYKGGDEAFWRLHQLDILDKHKAIIPVGAAYESVDIGGHMTTVMRRLMGDGAQFPEISVALAPAKRQFPLRNGAALLRSPISDNSPTNDDLKFAFDVAFGEGQILDGEPVVPALTQMCEFVEGVFDIFERAGFAP